MITLSLLAVFMAIGAGASAQETSVTTTDAHAELQKMQTEDKLKQF